MSRYSVIHSLDKIGELNKMASDSPSDSCQMCALSPARLKVCLLEDLLELVDLQFGHGKTPNETQADILIALKHYFGETNE